MNTEKSLLVSIYELLHHLLGTLVGIAVDVVAWCSGDTTIPAYA